MATYNWLCVFLRVNVLFPSVWKCQSQSPVRASVGLRVEKHELPDPFFWRFPLFLLRVTRVRSHVAHSFHGCSGQKGNLSVHESGAVPLFVRVPLLS